MRPPSRSSFLDPNNIITSSLTKSEKPCHGTARLLATSVNLLEQAPSSRGCGSGRNRAGFPLHTIFPNSSPQPSPVGATSPRCPSCESVRSERQLSLLRPTCWVARRAGLHNEATEACARSDVHTDAFFLFDSPLGAVSVGLVPSSDGAPERLR